MSMMINPFVFGGSPLVPRKLEVSVPAASVSAALAGYPVYIDLSTMPSGFWSGLAYPDGRDIRVRTAAGAELPFDLVTIMPISKAGSLFVKLDLSNVASTTFYIHFGDPSRAKVPITAANGRNACWSVFERVYTFGDSFSDRTGKGSDLIPNAQVYGLLNTSTSASLGVHQGIVWDGTYYYAIDTNQLKKYDSAFNLITSNNNPVGDIGFGVDHCADSEVVNGVLYVPVETFTAPDEHANMRIALFNASDLAFITSYAVAYASGVTTGVDMSSCAYNPADGYLYFGAWSGAGTTLWKWDMVNHEFVGTLTLSAALPRMQGLTFWRDNIYINRDDIDATIKVDLAGTVKGMVWGIAGGAYEGISHNDDGLLVLHDTSGAGAGVVRALIPRTQRMDASNLGVYLNSAGSFRAPSVPQLSTWTVGVSASVNATGASRSIASYTQTGANSSGADISKRETLAYRSTNLWGLWNQSDGWINHATSPGTGNPARLHGVHNGTTNRRLFVNGTLSVTDTGTIVMPPTGLGDYSLYLGVCDAQNAELWNGSIGFMYLYSGVLSNAWIAAEASNLTAPLSFYAVGAISDA